jgi:imidazole glycerol-phosphate synthase subunit HisH
VSAAPEVTIVPTGTANLASVRAGLARLGATTRMARGPSCVEGARRLMLPGVGAFGAARAALDATDLIAALRARLEADRPTLAICVGLQLLCDGSDESPEASGLGVVDARVERFRGSQRVPQMGWNHVSVGEGARFVREPGYAYFANSYRVSSVAAPFIAARSHHGEGFVAALERGALLACQFHPELSGGYGLEILRRWLEQEPD